MSDGSQTTGAGTPAPQLRLRLLTAAFGIPLALVLILVGGWWLSAAVAALALAGLREVYRLLAARGRPSLPWLGFPLGAALMVGAASFPERGGPPGALLTEAALLGAAVAAAGMWMLGASPRAVAPRLFATLAGHMYVPQLFSYLIRLRAVALPPVYPRWPPVELQAGACLVMLLMAILWGMDTAAYAVGKAWGRRKLCPAISPGKTVEGAIAGLVAATVLAALIAPWCRLSVGHGLVLGAGIGVIGQAGDLFESALKRRAGVKDSGALLPGHGGVLDRFDSLLFAAPFAFFYLALALRW